MPETKKGKKEKGELEVKTVNTVFLAGTIKKISISEEAGYFLLDVGQKRWVPCSVYGSPEIAANVGAFSEDDYIQIVGFIRPWSQKSEGGEWKNGLDVRVQQVKGGRKAKKYKQSEWTGGADEDVPF